MNLTFDKKLFLYLSFAFILMTIIGTVTHEFGHYFSAKVLGFNSRINYGMTILENNPSKIMSEKENFLFTLGGPFQTMLTGSIGLFILLIFRNSYKSVLNLTFKKWVFIFMTLFWLRQVANLFIWLLTYVIKGEFAENGDEIKLAKYLNLPSWSIHLLTATIGLIILTYVVFNFIPKNNRLTFIISGIFGGISGYILWLHYLGEKIMP